MMKSGILKCKIYLYNPQVDQQPDQDFESGGSFQLPSLESGEFYYNCCSLYEQRISCC